MSSLQLLYLGYNRLSGSLPDDLCQRLAFLQVLVVADNGLSGPIPSHNLSRCRELNTLYLGKLTNLNWLDLGFNNLIGRLPPTVGRWLPKLEVLLWEISLMDQFPAPSLMLSAYYAGSVMELILWCCSCRAWQFETPTAPRLQANFLTTESSTSEMNFLASLTNCKYWKHLWISENPINGLLPTQIGNLSSSLEIIYADFCNIKGSIPMEIGNLSNLIVLNLSNNELTGPIPKTMGRMQKLQVLRLEGNELQGSIPPELCQLQGLGRLSLGGNELWTFTFMLVKSDFSKVSKLELQQAYFHHTLKPVEPNIYPGSELVIELHWRLPSIRNKKFEGHD
ncbi:hypothetical protein GH714_030249 [Hevea brasiliensis]|uniref:Leucine-rich repeat-containing N-terminal plant-type domain-containing protein n=1 Tax=Hevea brasiliensis TaxID=3981 RepID=A0A6A6LG35_HEVBR|nr:hypothetical protein GH714_030249 [Hevea brasiliensis]